MEKFQIKLSTQKKVLFIPIINFLTVFFCSGINIRSLHLRARGLELFEHTFQHSLNLIGRGVLITFVFSPFYLILLSGMYGINIPQPFSAILLSIVIYLNTTAVSWIWIRYQKNIGIEEE